MYNIHSEFSLLQLLFITLKTRFISDKNVFTFCAFVFKKKNLIEWKYWNGTQGREIAECIHTLFGYFIEYNCLMKHCLPIQEFLSPPTSPAPPTQSKVIFLVRPSVGLTAGRNRHTFFVSVTAKMWFSFHEHRIYDGNNLKNFLTIPKLSLWGNYILFNSRYFVI